MCEGRTLNLCVLLAFLVHMIPTQLGIHGRGYRSGPAEASFTLTYPVIHAEGFSNHKNLLSCPSYLRF